MKSHWNLVKLGRCVSFIAIVTLCAVTLADTVWTAGSTTVDDLLNESNWSNGAPTSLDNPGVINDGTIGVSNTNYRPGAAGQDVVLTFGGTSQTSIDGPFIPLGNLNSGLASFTFEVTDSATVTASGNFWGGTNAASTFSPTHGNFFPLVQYYTGNSSFSAGEWWTAMSARSYILIADNASVESRSGNSGIGWNASSHRSVLEMADNGKLSMVNAEFRNGTVNMYNASSTTLSGTLKIYEGSSRVYLFDQAKLTVSGETNIYNGSVALNPRDESEVSMKTVVVYDNAGIVLTGDSRLTNTQLRINNPAQVSVTENAALTTDGTTYIGYDAAGAVFNQTGGTVNANGTTYFSWHADSTVNLSGGQFLVNGTIYGSDQNERVGNVNMSGDAYLKATTMYWGQHGISNINMTDNSVMETANFHLAYHFDAADTSETHIVMSGNSRITATGGVTPFSGVNSTDAHAYATVVMKDNSVFTVAGNFWGGKNNATNVTLPLDGKQYPLEMTFSDNSSFSATNEFWVAMSAKANVLIENNARVSAGTGTSGLGWSAGAEGSLLTMTGGALQVNAWNNHGSTMNVGGNALMKTNANFIMNKTESYLTVADDAVIKVAGTTYIGNDSDSPANFTQTGGLVLANGTTYFSYHADANVNISGGKYIANSAQLYVTDQNNRTANITMSGDGYLQAKDLRLSQHGKINLTMSGNSMIRANNFNAGFNYSAGDNVQTVITLGDSANITTGNIYFFGGNWEQGHSGAAYGSVTLNDNAKVTSYADTIVGRGTATGIVEGKDNSAEVTLNGKSEFSTGTYQAPAGTKSQTNVNDSATFTATTIDIGPESTFNLNGGSVNLRPYGFVKATEGTFNANGGAINLSASDSVTYSNGDQMISGLYSSQDAANAANALTTAPSGWQTAVLNVNGQYAVVAGYGAAPTGVKYWDSGSWAGATGNNTGFILGGDNAISSYDNQMVVLGGTNAFTNTIPAGTTLVFSGGTSTQDGTIAGTVLLNGGTMTVSNGSKNVTGYLELNGGTFSAPSSFWNDNRIVINSGSFTVGGSYLPMRYSSSIEMNGGIFTVPRLMICDSQGDYTCSFVQNDGISIVNGVIDVAQKATTHGSLIINGGMLTSSGEIKIAIPADSTGLMEVTGGTVNASRIIVGRAGAGDAAILRVSGGTVMVTQDLCGSGGTASGKTFVSGTGQMIFDSTYADLPIIREQAYLGIEGSGADGNGALRFIQSADSSSPITLTGNATIGIQGGQTLTMKAPFNSESDSYVLTFKGGLVNLASIEVGTLQNIALNGSYLTVNDLNYTGNVYGDADSRVFYNAETGAMGEFSGKTIQAGSVFFNGISALFTQKGTTLSAADRIVVDNNALIYSLADNAAISAKSLEVKSGGFIVEGNNAAVSLETLTADGGTAFFASQGGTLDVSSRMNVNSGDVVISGSTVAQTPDVTLGSNGQEAGLYVYENASLTINNDFVPINFRSGAAVAEFVVTDNATVKVNGNFFGGIGESISVVPLSDNDFVLCQEYSGNSQFTSNEWWSGVSVKTHINISDNASVTSLSGNSGLGWNAGAYGSVLNMTGGTLSVVNMNNRGSTMNFRGDSQATASGTWYTNSGENFTNVSENATVKVGGQFRLGDSEGMSTLNQSGGLFTVGGDAFFSFHGDSNVNISGGSFYANGGYLYITDQRNRVSNINLSGDSYLKANNFRVSQHGHTFMDVTDSAVLDVNEFNLAYNCDNGDNVQAYVTMSGDSMLRAANFYSFKGNNDNNHSGAGYASFSMTDNAKAYFTGNAWGGSNDADNVPGLVSGKDYNLEMNFGGDSYFSASEFWMAMAGKVHITIADNANVVARSGSSGLGWCEKTDGSLLEITGGNLSVSADAFFIGHSSTNADTGRANVIQTGGNATYSNISIRHSDSGYDFSGADSTLTVGNIFADSGSYVNIADGTVNLGAMTNAGAATINSGTINLQPYGTIVSTDGSFTVNGGAINAQASETLSYANGDQMLVGLFADESTANSVYNITNVPSGWVKSVVPMNGHYAVVASYGTAPEGVKIWVADASGSMGDSGNWQGDANNSTGFVISGTNTMNNIAGKTVVVGGANTFNGDVPNSATVAVSGGTTNYAGSNVHGNLIIDGGTFNWTASEPRVNQDGYLEINGGTVTKTVNGWFRTENEFVMNGGYFKIPEGYAMLYSSETTINGGEIVMNRLIIADTTGNYTSKYTHNGGSTVINGQVEVGQKNGTTGYFDVNGGSVTTTGDFFVGREGNSKGYFNVTDGTFSNSATLAVGRDNSSTGEMNVSGGDVYANRIIVGRAGDPDSGLLNVTGGTVWVNQDLCGTGGAPSGKTYVSGEGQMIFDSNYTDLPIIREQSYFGIEGSGANGAGALQFLRNTDFSTPITLTDDATIGIQDGSTVTAKAALNAESDDSVLTVKGGTLKMTQTETGSLKHVALDGSQLQMAPDADTAHFGFASVNMSADSSLTFPAGKTINIGNPDDTEAFTTSVMGDGTFTIDSTLYLDAYTTDRGTGLDKLDFSGFDGNLSFDAPLNLVVHLDDASDFLGQVVTLDWLVDAPAALYNIDNINLTLLNDDGVSFVYWLNADGSITFGDHNAIPEPSTWALLVLGVIALMYWRRRKN
ncbi:MAG: PEP-CTERM sorting domain-containing protein [Thermoguttaceae bacterium]|nr:PEP-CTERM sorting domain-containing protein [Thermoguttaceae bacterium]